MFTPDPDFYCRTWTIKNTTTETAYPINGTVKIDISHEELFEVAWTDSHSLPHVLVGLTLESGVLTGSASELNTPHRWVVQIEEGDSDQEVLRINATVRFPHPGVGQGDLSGNWGAEAPPNEPPA